MEINNHIVSGLSITESAKGKTKSDPELKKACRDFEALFINQIFRSMRRTVPEGGLIDEKHGEKIYREMLDMEVASNLSMGKGLGLAEMLYRQLAGTVKGKR